MDFCVWKYDWNQDTWECLGCGGEWQMIEGTPQENNIHYCPFCGAKIQRFTYPAED